MSKLIADPYAVLRILLIALSIAGIILFLFPLQFHIVNIGNLFGLAASIVLLAGTLFHRPLLQRLWTYRAGKITLSVIVVILIAGVLYCLVISCFMLHAANKKPKQTPRAVIVLGCKVNGTVPSLMLSRRIRAAYEILNQYPDITAVVSGGQGSNEDISEAQCMANELMRMGISAERILLEDRSTSTSENLRFSKQILDEQGIGGELLIATDAFHEMRAQVLAKKEGLPDCCAASAQTSWYLFPTYWVREWFGLAHAFVFGT